MCGIAGIFEFEGRQQVDRGTIEAMIFELRHRGPDATGVFLDEGIGLGHQRLAILDLRPESNQPFFSDDRRYCIVYNGEVFNYIELRKELQELGCVFRTESDTEVVLQAYIRWGVDAARKFNGMWAFAIYDSRSKQLFCSRDRFGVKPFNYAAEQGRFYFASEAKAILKVNRSFARPCFEAISDVLRLSHSACNAQTPFCNVFRLPAAHHLTVNQGGIHLQRYWEYPLDNNRDISMGEAAEQLRELLASAVKLRLRSDVPVGITLSSGVDSSAIAAFARKSCDLPLDTFTAVYDAGEASEWEVAERWAHKLHMTPHPVPCSAEDFLDILNKVTWHLETPHSSPAMLPYWNIMKFARQKVTVLLEGQGADELLGGYNSMYFSAAIADLLWQGKLAAAVREASANYRMFSQHPLQGRAMFAGWLARSVLPFSRRLVRGVRGDEGVYAGPLDDRNLSREPMQHRPETERFQDRLNRHLATSHETTLVNLLAYGDAISMAHSLESRLPFMDYRLVEFAFSLPGRLKYADGWGKKILRTALEQDVDRSILYNPHKLGFVTPLAKWFRDRPDEAIYPILQSASCRSRGIFDHRRLDQLVRRHVDGKLDLSSQIFRWIMTELWFQKFID